MLEKDFIDEMSFRKLCKHNILISLKVQANFHNASLVKLSSKEFRFGDSIRLTLKDNNLKYSPWKDIFVSQLFGCSETVL